jgi:hypothetical protein
MLYLKQCDSMMILLFSRIHVSSAMPAKGEELRVLQWADAAAVQCNIFVCQGQVMLVFLYNKAS